MKNTIRNAEYTIKPVSDLYHYPHIKPQTRKKLLTERYEYDFPFKYENIKVNRYVMRARETHGMEMNPVNMHVIQNPDGTVDGDDYRGDNIVITDECPMVRVVVIGSACTPPGWIQIDCEPIPEWRNRYEENSILPVRFRQDNLWGMHLRVDAASTKTPGVKQRWKLADEKDEYEAFPEGTKELYKSTIENPNYHKSSYHENPLAGMSCAVFEIPPSKQVIVQGGSQVTGWCSDNFPGDCHYSFRTIRVDVLTH